MEKAQPSGGLGPPGRNIREGKRKGAGDKPFAGTEKEGSFA